MVTIWHWLHCVNDVLLPTLYITFQTAQQLSNPQKSVKFCRSKKDNSRYTRKLRSNQISLNLLLHQLLLWARRTDFKPNQSTSCNWQSQTNSIRAYSFSLSSTHFQQWYWMWFPESGSPVIDYYQMMTQGWHKDCKTTNMYCLQMTCCLHTVLREEKWSTEHFWNCPGLARRLWDFFSRRFF